ncbi:hypothetical protein [Ekhidna sp.]|uniref:hypothetical protein n=1 Tax=Ekhidna sp. TaxID=2608089 RepID=UPI003B5A2B75
MDNSLKILGTFLFIVLSLGSNAQMALGPSNSNTSNAVKGDLEAPRTDLLRTHTGDFVYGPATRIKFKIIEEGSGIETTFFKVGDSPFMQSDGRQMMPHDLADGAYKMLYYSVDKEGNQEQVRMDMVYIDKEGPRVKSSFNATPVSFKDGMPVLPHGVHVLLEIADEKVNVQKVTYQINNGQKVESDDLHTIDLAEELSAIADDTIRIEVTAYDEFYNISKEVIAFKIKR